MKIRVLGCSGGEYSGLHASGFLIDGRLLFEAGTVTSVLTSEEQAGITDVLISHAHLDHIKELAFLADNLFPAHAAPIRIMAIPEVIETLRNHFFNDKIWPDFTRLPRDKPILSYDPVHVGQAHPVGSLVVTPVAVSHTIPAAGFVIDDGVASIAFTGDTGKSDAFWERIRPIANLKAVVTECSFPDSQADLARESGHLTPSMLSEGLAILSRPDVAVYISHIKPAFLEQVVSDLKRISPPGVVPLVQGQTLVI
jgi:cAMP phosphodiesterase